MGGGKQDTQGPPSSYRMWGEGEARATILVLHTLECMQISLSPISVLLRQPLSIKKSYAGAVQLHCKTKVNDFTSPAGMSLTKLSLAGMIKFFPGQGEVG